MIQLDQLLTLSSSTQSNLNGIDQELSKLFPDSKPATPVTAQAQTANTAHTANANIPAIETITASTTINTAPTVKKEPAATAQTIASHALQFDILPTSTTPILLREQLEEYGYQNINVSGKDNDCGVRALLLCLSSHMASVPKEQRAGLVAETLGQMNPSHRSHQPARHQQNLVTQVIKVLVFM